MYQLRWQIQKLRNILKIVENIIQKEKDCIEDSDFINYFGDYEIDKLFLKEKRYNDILNETYILYDEYFYDFDMETNVALKEFICSFEKYKVYWKSIQAKKEWWKLIKHSLEWKSLKQNAIVTQPLILKYMAEIGIRLPK